jgi:NADPH-dependent 2,4-dienoyl-CoA reductase/sulfur reductase-like enzyme
MPQHVVIIGAVALGPKAACRFKRIEPESKVTMIDQSRIISYGGCGIPYFVSGDVSDPQALQSTSFNMLRDETFFRNAKDINVRTNTLVTAIDRKKKQVFLKDLDTRKDDALDYDKLVLAIGSRPRTLNIPGSELEGVFTVSNLERAIIIKEKISKGEVVKAVIIGAGAIGLEMAEALSDLWGIETTVMEIQDQILPGIISANLAKMG